MKGKCCSIWRMQIVFVRCYPCSTPEQDCLVDTHSIKLGSVITALFCVLIMSYYIVMLCYYYVQGLYLCCSTKIANSICPSHLPTLTLVQTDD